MKEETKNLIRSHELMRLMGPEADVEGESNHRLSPQVSRGLLEARGFFFPKKNLIFHCLKGGAAKTTLAYNTAFRFSQLGAKVLLVDLDKQANATQTFGAEPRQGKVFVDVITGDADIKKTLVHLTPTFSILPSSLENARLEMELVHRTKNPRTFYKTLFAPIRDDYDFLVFDLPPDLSHNTFLATLYADTVCVPVSPDEYGVHGMKLTLGSLKAIYKDFDDLEQDVWVVWSKYDSRERLATRYVTDISDVAPGRFIPNVIRSDISFRNAQAQGKSVFQLGKRTNAGEDIDLLVRELLGLREFFDPPNVGMA